MPFDLEWRETADTPGRWRQFASADELKAFVADTGNASAALHGELRIRSRARDDAWETVTTAAAVARWSPPARPAALLAARWTVEDAVAASQGRHVQRVRSCLEAARDDGLVNQNQVEAMVSLFEQAVSGEGPAGRHHEPLAARPDDIAPMSGQAGSTV